MTRKIGVLLLMAVLMISICSIASATIYYVTGNNVRLRSGPGTDYSIVGHMSFGQKVDVEGTTGGWAYFGYSQSDSFYAFISTKYISRTKPTSSSSSHSSSTVTTPSTVNEYATFQATNYYVIVNPANSYVNMRWEANKTSPVRRIYYYGARLRVLAENSNWCQVMDESTGEVGFIMRSLLLRTN